VIIDLVWPCFLTGQQEEGSSTLTTYNFEKFLSEIYKIDDVGKAASLLSWDREIIMPAAGSEYRVEQLTTLATIHHELFASQRMGDLLSLAEMEMSGAEFDSFEASLLRLVRRDYDNEMKLTPDYVERESRTSELAYQAWVEARKNDDFAAFLPWLTKIVELNREKAELYGYDDVPYDALLDKYEQGATTRQVEAVLTKLKNDLVPLLQSIQENADRVSDELVRRGYDIEIQKQLAAAIADSVGFDFKRGHLGVAVHPFATSTSLNDVRITTRYNHDFLNESLFGTLHESGHGIYEQGVEPVMARTGLCDGASLGLHESQSRMFENFVGRSLGFWESNFPGLQELFPDQLRGVRAEQFYQAINKVEPSLIRVEADEVTYNLHIILRFELEQAMLNGELNAADLPAAWNEKMSSSLGITPPDDATGCLQDVHWSSVIFGYFPTYALGNLYAAQFMESALEQQPQIKTQLDVGDSSGLLSWLGENIHRHGAKYEPTEILRRATGQEMSHEPLVRYLKAKFGAIYGLR